VTPTVLFENADLIAVDKPEGLAVIPERKRAAPCLMEWLAARDSSARLFVVHRIDKDVSGVLLVAKSAQVHRELNRLFETRQVRKTYVGVVHGLLAASSGRITAPIRQFGSSRMGVDPRAGKPSVTTYRVTERRGPFTHVAIHPVTGRRHQIRVHFYSLGHPLVGDPRYGDPDVQRAYPRLLLHARMISFRLGSGRPIRITAPLPGSFTDLAARLGRVETSVVRRPRPPRANAAPLCRPMAAGEAGAVAALARRVFDSCVAMEVSNAGRRSFLAYARPVRILERLDRGHRVLVAVMEGRLAGMIEVRDDTHIAMLFVERDAQRHGVARTLIAAAFSGEGWESPADAHAAVGAGTAITVNATPGSIAAYAHLGFRPTGPARDSDGLRVLPMARPRARIERTSPSR
jgi:RluA family pseudouridine synthase